MNKRIYNLFRLKGLILLLIVLMLGASACNAPAHLPAQNEPVAPVKDAYSVFIYFCGSDLETKHGAATKNIQELLDAGLSNDVNIVLQTGGAKKWRAFGISSENIQRYEVAYGELELLESLPNDSMGKPATLSDFLSYGIQNYPAEKYAAIIWNHGGGSVSGVAFDEQYGYDSLTLSELQYAFEKVSDSEEEKFEMIGLDACLMATLETAQTLSPFCCYMVASQDISPATGWDYKAIAKAICKNPSQRGDELGAVICDSYYEKCRVQEKDDTATISVVDLNKIPALSERFESLSGKTQGYQDDLYCISRCIEDSLAYGGLTKQEGYSNLFDLGCFAENMEDADVSAAVKNAVIYQRTGDQRSQATGLSFYYPQTFIKSELEKYLSAFPDSKYSSFLTAAYSDMPQNTIQFSDDGSIAADGGISVRLSNDSLRYVSSVEFELIKDNGAGNTVRLGMDNSLYSDWDSGSFTSDFQGYWIAFDEHMLQSRPVDETENSLIFSAPVLLNGGLTNLRFSFEFEQQNHNPSEALDGHYEILGTWDGLNLTTGMSKAHIAPLEEGDEITVLHEDSSGELVPGEAVIYHSGSIIHDCTLGDGLYRYRIIITDIFGQKHSSSTAVFEVGKTSEGNPLAELIRIEKTDKH